MAWHTTDGSLLVDGSTAAGPLTIVHQGGPHRETFSYDPFLDLVYGSDRVADEVLRDLREQLDEVRGAFFLEREDMGLPLTLGEVLWRPGVLLDREGGLFVAAPVADGDAYPREVRYGQCVADEVSHARDPWDILVFEGYQVTDGSRWVRKDGVETPVLDLAISRAPLLPDTPCLRPWAASRIDRFLSRRRRGDWKRM